MSSGCTEILVNHVLNLFPRKESVRSFVTSLGDESKPTPPCFWAARNKLALRNKIVDAGDCPDNSNIFERSFAPEVHGRSTKGVSLTRNCTKWSALILSGLAFDLWPTHRYLRIFRRDFEVIELQACHRVLHRHEEIKIVNIYQCFLVCSHYSIGRCHRCGDPGPPFRLSSNSFCSACALMLRSHPRIFVLLEFL